MVEVIDEVAEKLASETQFESLIHTVFNLNNTTFMTFLIAFLATCFIVFIFLSIVYRKFIYVQCDYTSKTDAVSDELNENLYKELISNRQRLAYGFPLDAVNQTNDVLNDIQHLYKHKIITNDEAVSCIKLIVEAHKLDYRQFFTATTDFISTRSQTNEKTSGFNVFNDLESFRSYQNHLREHCF